MQIVIGDRPLTRHEVVLVARHGAPVALSASALDRVAEARSIIDSLAEDTRPHYGISTGFGALANTQIAPADRAQLQRSLVRSHAASSGDAVETEVVRGLMLLRLQTLMTGRTGARPATVELYAGMLNAGITPIVGEYGSLGCSGDLAPLSHVALAAMGEGMVRVDGGEPVPAGEALAAAGLAFRGKGLVTVAAGACAAVFVAERILI